MDQQIQAEDASLKQQNCARFENFNFEFSTLQTCDGIELSISQGGELLQTAYLNACASYCIQDAKASY